MEAQGASSHTSGHSSGHSALGTGSVLESHALGLVTPLQTRDDLWTQSGCSHSQGWGVLVQMNCSAVTEFAGFRWKTRIIFPTCCTLGLGDDPHGLVSSRGQFRPELQLFPSVAGGALVLPVPQNNPVFWVLYGGRGSGRTNPIQGMETLANCYKHRIPFWFGLERALKPIQSH